MAFGVPYRDGDIPPRATKHRDLRVGDRLL